MFAFAGGSNNFTCVQMDTLLLTGYGLLSYSTVVAGIIACGNYLGRRLRDFAAECALERKQQNEMFERLLAMTYDDENYYGDVEGQEEQQE